MTPDLKWDVTRLLEAAKNGDAGATDRLLSLVYDELRMMAQRQMDHELPGQTLQATALVHEVWLRLFPGHKQPSWDSRGHFFVAAAESMRRVLVDAARARNRKKRGGNNKKRELRESDSMTEPKDIDLIALDDALNDLETEDVVKANLVKLRFFAGMTNLEASQHLGLSTATAERYWAFARAWLRMKLDSEPDESL